MASLLPSLTNPILIGVPLAAFGWPSRPEPEPAATAAPWPTSTAATSDTIPIAGLQRRGRIINGSSPYEHSPSDPGHAAHPGRRPIGSRNSILFMADGGKSVKAGPEIQDTLSGPLVLASVLVTGESQQSKGG